MCPVFGVRFRLFHRIRTHQNSKAVEDMTIPTASIVQMAPLKDYMPKLTLLLAVFGLRQVGSGYAFYFGGC
jgi:hypothetical protein